MTLREYINQLQAFANDNPEALDLEVITATDEEGNGYMSVYYEPTMGYLEDDFFNTNSEEKNAVCVN